MNRTNLFAAATLVLGLFACDRNADRASQTNTTSATQPADTSGAAMPAPLSTADTTSTSSVETKDGGRAGMTTTTGSDMEMNAKDGGHAAITTSGTSGTDMAAKDGGHRAGTTVDKADKKGTAPER